MTPTELYCCPSYSIYIIFCSFVMSEQNRKVKQEEEKLLQKLDRQISGSTMMSSTCGALLFCGPPSLVERKQGNYKQFARAYSQT